MFARSTSINAQPTMIDPGIAHVRHTVMPALSHLNGYLGLPADVEPAVGQLPGVTLVDLATLGRRLATADGPDDVPQVRAIVSAEVASYVERRRQASAGPVIAALHAHVRQLADAELARLHERLPGLSDTERAETAATVHRILRKVLHRPTVRVKEFSNGPDGPGYLDALRQLFDL